MWGERLKSKGKKRKEKKKDEGQECASALVNYTELG